MVGKTILHYKILEKLGEGGMGIVYKAEDTRLKRIVALKFLPSYALVNEEERARFAHEAQAAAALDHSNICAIYEINEAEGQSFISMACIEGQSLKEKIESGPLRVDETVDIAVQIAQGLKEAQEHGVVHRDIKPANIMITPKSQIKIMDFGLAKIDGQTKLTKTGTTLGTAAYMSPEQVQGKDVDHRSDIWSFAVVLYEMLAGKPPFKGQYDQAVMYAIMNEDPVPIRKINPEVPAELERILNRALKKNRELRYSSATEIYKDLKQYQNSLRAAEMGEPNLRTLLRRIRKPRVAVPAVCALLGLLVVGVWFFGRQAKIRWAK
jgi:serine/threonine protein kinase